MSLLFGILSEGNFRPKSTQPDKPSSNPYIYTKKVKTHSIHIRYEWMQVDLSNLCRISSFLKSLWHVGSSLENKHNLSIRDAKLHHARVWGLLVANVDQPTLRPFQLEVRI